MPPLAHLTGRNQYAPKRNNDNLANNLLPVKRAGKPLWECWRHEVVGAWPPRGKSNTPIVHHSNVRTPNREAGRTFARPAVVFGSSEFGIS